MKITVGFCIVEISHLILEYILKYGYFIHHFNVNFLLYVFLMMILLATYFIFILDYGNYIR